MTAGLLFPALFDRPAGIEGVERHQRRLPQHVLDHYPGGPVLVVIFEDARGPVLKPDPLRELPGVGFLRREGHSVLAVKTLKRDWYRGRPLLDFMGRLAQQGFFAAFERVVFYGSSMGGYGALAFSCLAPRALVLSYSPQTTLDPALVPWDTRYPVGSAADWSGPFADGAVCAASAARVVVVYDPFERSDTRQVARLARHNLLALKLPFAGHATQPALQQMGQLKVVLPSLLASTLQAEGFALAARRRRQLVEYWVAFARRARRLSVQQACLARAEAIDPATLPALALRAEVTLAAGDPAAAEAAARQGLALKPGARRLTETLIRALQAQGLAEAALAAAQAALASDPKHLGFIQPCIRLLLQQGEPAAAQQVLQAALLRLPRHPRLLQLAREAALPLPAATIPAEPLPA